jgi:isopenicillin-N N-acyltransferase like protein
VRRHVSIETDPFERGRGFGRAHAGAVMNTVAVYERLLGEANGLDRAALESAGHEVLAVLEDRWPELALELAGVAEGAGQPPALLAAVNARTELMGDGSACECSLVASVAEPTVAQTWDWHPELRRSMVLWSVVQPPDRWFTTLTEAGMLAKLGVSSAGVGLGLNFLRSSEDGGVGGVPIHVLLRVILERCDGLDDAISLLRAAPVTASSSITVASAGGIVAAELSPGGCTLVEPEPDGRLVHTNHFLGGPASGRDLERDSGDGSELRREHLRRAIATEGFDPAALLRSHNAGPEQVCRHEDADGPWADRRATLAATIIEPGRRSLTLCEGTPCRSPFEAVELP